MRIKNLFFVLLMAGLSFGGTFTCSTHSDDDDFHVTSASDTSTTVSGSSTSSGSSSKSG